MLGLLAMEPEYFDLRVLTLKLEPVNYLRFGLLTGGGHHGDGSDGLDGVRVVASIVNVLTYAVGGAEVHNVVHQIFVVNKLLLNQHLFIQRIYLLGRAQVEGELFQEDTEDLLEIWQGSLQLCGVDPEVVVEGEFDRCGLQDKVDQDGRVALLGSPVEDHVPDLLGMFEKERVLVGPVGLKHVRQVQTLVDVDQQLLRNGLENPHRGEFEVGFSLNGDVLEHRDDVSEAALVVQSVQFCILCHGHCVINYNRVSTPHPTLQPS